MANSRDPQRAANNRAVDRTRGQRTYSGGGAPRIVRCQSCGGDRERFEPCANCGYEHGVNHGTQEEDGDY